MQAIRAAARPARGITSLPRRQTASAVRTLKTLTPIVPEAPSKDPQLQGYPDMPYVSKQRRTPYAQYDDPQMRRNFEETVRMATLFSKHSLITAVSMTYSFMRLKKSCPCGVRTRP